MKSIQAILCFFSIVELTLVTSCSDASLKEAYPNIQTANVMEVQLVSVVSATDSLGDFRLTFEAKSDTTKKMEMIVGKYEAQILTVNIFKTKHNAPLPLDLLEDAISKFGYTVKSVLINGVVDSIYTSQIICSDNVKIVSLNSRAVDAVTVAEKVKCPIYIATKLMNH
jgi:bifunctional DNase/RNase